MSQIMKRGIWRKHFAVAVVAGFLLFVGAIMLPSVWWGGQRDADGTLIGADASIVHMVSVKEPLRIAGTPPITLSEGNFSTIDGRSGSSRDLLLEQANFIVDLGEAWTEPVGSVLAEVSYPILAQLAALGFNQVRVADSRVVVRWGIDQLRVLGDFEMEFAHRRSGQATARGKFHIGGQEVAFEAAIGTETNVPTRSLHVAGQSEADERIPETVTALPVKASLKSGESTVLFDGYVAAEPKLALTGKVAARLSDAPNILRATGIEMPRFVGIEKLEFSGQVKWSDAILASDSTRVRIGPQEAVGAIVMRFNNARPAVEGTLAIDRLDLRPLLIAQNPAAANQPIASVWPKTLLSLPLANYVDADLRVSAKQVFLGSDLVGKALATITMKMGKLHADIPQLELPNISGAVQINADLAGAVPIYAARSRFETQDVGWLLDVLADLPGFKSKAEITLDVATSGVTAADAVKALRGRMQISSNDPVRVPFDLQRLLTQSKNMNPPSAGWAALAGESIIQRLDVRAQVLNETVSIDRGEFEMKAGIATMQGVVKSPDGRIDLKLSMPRTAGAGGAGPSQEGKGDAAANSGVVALAIRGARERPQIMPIDATMRP